MEVIIYRMATAKIADKVLTPNSLHEFTTRKRFLEGRPCSNLCEWDTTAEQEDVITRMTTANIADKVLALDLRTTASQKREAVPRRARI